MSTAEMNYGIEAKLADVKKTFSRVFESGKRICLTCSFQAEDVLLAKLAIELLPEIPILFLDTGYHFQEVYEYRDKVSAAWKLNLINIQPELSVIEQEATQGLLYQTAPDLCCKQRKVEPLFRALSKYEAWITGLRREQAKSRSQLEEETTFQLSDTQHILKLAPLALWSTRDIWYACKSLSIPLLSLYEKGYTSIGCEPCTSLPTDAADPRSGRWGGHKVECGIHIENE